MYFRNFCEYISYIEKNPITNAKHINNYSDINEYLYTLYSDYTKASIYMTNLDDIEYVHKNEPEFYNGMKGFFVSCNYATVDALITLFYKLTETRSEVGNIDDLLNFIEKQIYEYCLDNTPNFSIEILNKIYSVREEKSKMHSIMKKIKYSRNNIVAHNGKYETVKKIEKFMPDDYDKLLSLLHNVVEFVFIFFENEEIKKSEIIDRNFDYNAFKYLFNSNNYFGKPLKYYCKHMLHTKGN